MARKNVGELRVGQAVTVAGRAGPYVILKFPSRRIALVGPSGMRNGRTEPLLVSLHDLRPLEVQA